jgi:hypothetical protein
MKGLHACGDMIGGLFYDNYPAGAGLVSGATFGDRGAVRGGGVGVNVRSSPRTTSAAGASEIVDNA